MRLAALVAATLVLLAACAGSGPVRREGGGWEESIGGVRVVHLEGTPEQMGRQMGEMCGASIRVLLTDHLKQLHPVEGGRDEMVARARVIAEGMPADQRAETVAMANAAGVSVDDAWLAAVVVEMFQAPMCAGVAAWGDATVDGATVVGRNLDWFDHAELHRHGAVIVRHRANARTTVSVGFPGIAGVFTGMNADGLFVANLVELGPGDRSPIPRRGIPVMSLLRLVLERCGNVEDAVLAFEAATRTVPQHYLVADAHGAVFLDTTSGFVKPRPAVSQTTVGTNYSHEARGENFRDPRYELMCREIDASHGRIDLDRVKETLARANLGPLSIQSVVARPAERFLAVSTGRVPACEGPFVDVGARRLLGGSR